MIKLLVIAVIAVAALCVLFWLALSPKKIQLQNELGIIEKFEYETPLLTEVDPSMPSSLILRRVLDSTWRTSGKHTNFQLQEYTEPSLSAHIIKPDVYLKSSLNEPARIVLGRFNDTGAGMHGWHVTMVRQGDNPISFDRHQRYYVWIEKDFPTGFTDSGEPISNNPKRWYFSGLADIIDNESYQGYFEPEAGDR